MSDMLRDAASKGYAVPCFNAINLDMVRGIIQAAEEECSPVIICHAEIHFKYTPLEKIAPILVAEMNAARVPVAVLLDHGKSFDAVLKAMQLGFNAVMFDGSEYGYEENVSKTAEIVKIAKTFDVSVEGELGYVTRPRGGGAEGEDEDSIVSDTSLYTDPEQACDFAERTGVDALAVAFGTVHGVYLKEPKLELDRLSRIRALTDVPLVMHGGSGLSRGDFEQSIQGGIAKVNYYTNMALKVAERLRVQWSGEASRIFYHDLMMASIHEFREDARQVMKMLGSSRRA
ncbi:class II fructose-bisphosphate aldolase [Paenibacillus sp. MY03]|uniref:class II fructose-bisphosphate aldolase n=1 Tax=Paenibacillus sp. MY03 TaxID=302980 RepID=UPI0015C5F22B|nr:class II fructose-bisphosphate aldolase [Paenibacillus sp. MY03]